MSLRATIVKGVFEMILVGIGVFLGMAADEWRTDQQRHSEAIEALRRFKVEIENNRAAVANVVDYHTRMREELIKYFKPETKESAKVRFQGIQPVTFEHTAWDLAIATQWLAEIDPTIAFELTRVYGLQQTHAGLSNGILQSMYIRPVSADLDGFLQSVKTYYDDLVIYEPELLKRYDRVLPLIERALKD